MASAAEWSKRVSAWRASGQSADEYAAGRGFAGATLRWWSSRLGRSTPGLVATSEVVRLARVVRSAPVASPIVVEVGGARVLVPLGADRATLAVVLAALGAAS